MGKNASHIPKGDGEKNQMADGEKNQMVDSKKITYFLKCIFNCFDCKVVNRE